MTKLYTVDSFPTYLLTRKHLATVAPNKEVLVLTIAREGKLHDKRFHDEDDIIGSILDEIPVLVDSGFQGVQKQ